MASRAIAWVKADPSGAEFVDVVIEGRRLGASGIAIGWSAPSRSAEPLLSGR